MKLKYCLLIMCSVLFFAERVSAQAIIGDITTAPKDYAVLEINGVGGLQLPALTTVQRNTLNPDIATGSGLVIYNVDEKVFQFWDGAAWGTLKSIGSLTPSANGITGTEAFKLGTSSIAEETTIAQSGKNLFFDVTTGKFSIKNTAFTVSSVGVGIGTATPAANLHVASSAEFRYNDPSIPNPNGYVMVSTQEGANWQNLSLNPVLITGEVTDGVVISSASESPVKIGTLSLGKGIWMIMARYVATSSSIGTWGYNSWLHIRNNGEDKLIIGQVPKSTSDLVTTPQAVYIVKTLGNEEFELWGGLKVTTGTVKIETNNPTYGDSYFQAIRLSE